MRKQTRQYWKCDCASLDGAAESFTGLPDVRGRKEQLQLWGNIFGKDKAPDTCPWKAYDDSLVQEIVETFGDIGGFSEQGPDLVGFMNLNPPQILLAGLKEFRVAFSQMKSHVQQKQAKENEKQLKSIGRTR